jgi:hypothetical protein
MTYHPRHRATPQPPTSHRPTSHRQTSARQASLGQTSYRRTTPEATRPPLSRRSLLGVSGLAVAAAGAAPLVEPSAAAAATSVPLPFIPYSAPASYFRSTIGGLTPDAARTAAFHSFMATHPDQRSFAYPRIKGIDASMWGTVFALSTAADPIWKLTGQMSPFCSTLATTGFHAPEWLGSVLTGTSDSPFCVIDLGSGFTVFGGKASVVGPRTISVQSAGITYHSSNGLHRSDPLSNDKRNFTSRGRISEAMVIRSDLIAHGIANNTDLGHVLHMFLVETRSSDGFRHPMVACESGKYGFGAEGERIAIDPAVDLTKRGLSPAGLVVARTLQRFGCYFGDNAGRESTLKAEQETSAHPVWKGMLTQDSLAGLRWEDFVVLRST